MLILFRAQPLAFRMIFLLEIWERFGYYTVQGILTLYFIRKLGFDQTTAYLTFGAFSALVYSLVSLGGYLGDSVLGTKRTIVIGLVVLALGYGFLTIAQKNQVFLALGLICVGNGLFKANPSSLLAKCYEEGDKRLHGAFTLYYMAINLGSTVALFAGPFLSSYYGYPYAFFLAFLGLLMGLLNYGLQHHHLANIITFADKRKLTVWQWALIAGGIIGVSRICAYLLQHLMLTKSLVWLIAVIVLIFYLIEMFKEKKTAFMKMLVALILMLEAIIFFTLYQQMPTSLNLFAVNNVIPRLLGIHIDAQSFQALNSIWIIVLSPLLAKFYSKLNEQQVSFSVPYKFAFGMVSCGISFSLLYFARFFHDDAGMVSFGWLVVSYFFQSLGELLVSALGVAMVAELVPARMSGFVMGMWFLTSAVAGFVGAFVASFTALPSFIHPGIESLMIYTKVFATIGLITLSFALLMWLNASRLSQYIR